jgi:hypothetical protein
MLMVYLLPQGGVVPSFQMPCSVDGWLPGRDEAMSR